MSERTQRRLAAIVSADVVGYSRLMGVDEVGTLAALRDHRNALIDPKIAEHGGRIVKTMGDGLLLEFPSVVNAVKCVIEIQQGMAERNQGIDEALRITFRVGVNQGDIIIDGDDIHGDGVNVAARLQGIAEPGGVSISRRVHEDVRNRLDTVFEDTGEQTLKNIAHPIHVWRWAPTAAGNMMSRDAPLPLPTKPSIAVLPFDNMSGDPEQEYLADGITEDIITALSKFRWFFVTARNSTFTYKGTAVDIKQVGRELGVRYVLEGSVRKAGSRVRITAQLIEAENGNHIWAERYDRELSDIFELQDEITLTIASAVEPEFASFERDRALHKPTEDLRAWDIYHRGLAKIWQMDKDSMADGAALMRQAVAMDRNFGQAYAYLAFVEYWNVILGRTDDREKNMRQGMDHARTAISIDQRDYIGHWALGRLHNVAGDPQAAINELEASISINPNFVHAYHGLATVHTHAGRPEKAIEYADMAIRLSPNDPLMWTFLGYKSMAYAMLQDFENAISYMEQCCRFPTAQFIPHTLLAAFYALVDRADDAVVALKNARRLEPILSLKMLREYLGTHAEESFEKYYEGFRKIGLTE